MVVFKHARVHALASMLMCHVWLLLAHELETNDAMVNRLAPCGRLGISQWPWWPKRSSQTPAVATSVEGRPRLRPLSALPLGGLPPPPVTVTAAAELRVAAVATTWAGACIVVSDERSSRTGWILRVSSSNVSVASWTQVHNGLLSDIIWVEIPQNLHLLCTYLQQHCIHMDIGNSKNYVGIVMTYESALRIEVYYPQLTSYWNVIHRVTSLKLDSIISAQLQDPTFVGHMHANKALKIWSVHVNMRWAFKITVENKSTTTQSIRLPRHLSLPHKQRRLQTSIVFLQKWVEKVFLGIQQDLYSLNFLKWINECLLGH